MTAPEPGSTAGLLSLRDVVSPSDGFGSPGLAGVDLDLKEREILAVVGPAGAGKTALLATVAGLRPFERGSIVFRGYPIRLRGPRDGVRIGIAASRLPSELVPDLTVYENVVLPSFSRPARLELQSQRKHVTELLAALSPEEVPLDTPASRLSRAQALVVGLVQALASRAKLYLFDEPFAVLTPRAADTFAAMLARLRTSGCGIVVTSRRLDEMLPVADRVMALVDGRTVLAGDARSEEDRPRLRRVIDVPRSRTAPQPLPVGGPPALVVTDLSARPALRGASFGARPGEILAVYGRPGSGATALVESLAGLRTRRGSVTLDGDPVPGGAVQKLARFGIAFCGPAALSTGDAQGGPGLLPDSPRDLGDLWQQLGFADEDLERSPSRSTRGARQRLAFAAAVARGPRLLVLDDPARGLAAADRTTIYAAISIAARRGCAVVMACSDPSEALAVAHRVLIMRDGHMICDLPQAMLDEDGLALLSLPAASLTRHATALADLAGENQGAAFWATFAGDHVLCLDLAVADNRADPGLSPACISTMTQSRVAEALHRHVPGEFVSEPDGSRSTMLVPVRSRLGRPLGWIGLTLGPGQTPPPPAAVAFRVEALGSTL